MPPNQNKPPVPLYKFGTYKRSDVEPAWKSPPPDMTGLFDIIPDARIDTTFDRDNFLASQPLPEIRPALLGLRASVAKKRLARAEKRLEQLAEDEAILRFAGKNILDEKGFRKPDENLRPRTIRQHLATKHLNVLRRKRQLRKRVANNLGASYLPHVNDRVQGHHYEPTFTETRAPQLITERLTDARNEIGYNRLSRQIGRRDERFTNIISKPALKADEVIERRNKVTLKLAALEQARAGHTSIPRRAGRAIGSGAANKTTKATKPKKPRRS